MQLGSGLTDELVDRTMEVLAPHLAEGEEVLLLAKGGTKYVSDVLAVTSSRVIEIESYGKVSHAVRILDFDRDKLIGKMGESYVKTGMVNGADLKWKFQSRLGANADRDKFIEVLKEIVLTLGAETTDSMVFTRGATPPSFNEVATVNFWETTTFVGGMPSKKALGAIARLAHSPEDRPWFVLHSWISGVIAAFDDRMILIKTGALTSFGAGSLGGERATTFYYPDITAIEFNSGLMNGVLEILTASYSGGGNKDFWRGSTKSFNADSNNPFTLSNTLPLDKSGYKDALPQINELRRKISESKRTTVTIIQSAPEPIPATGGGLAAQIRELKELHDAGALNADEFNAAKAKLLS